MVEISAGGDFQHDRLFEMGKAQFKRYGQVICDVAPVREVERFTDAAEPIDSDKLKHPFLGRFPGKFNYEAPALQLLGDGLDFSLGISFAVERVAG